MASSTYSDPRLYHLYKVFRCRWIIPHANPHHPTNPASRPLTHIKTRERVYSLPVSFPHVAWIAYFPMLTGKPPPLSPETPQRAMDRTYPSTTKYDSRWLSISDHMSKAVRSCFCCLWVKPSLSIFTKQYNQNCIIWRYSSLKVHIANLPLDVLRSVILVILQL